METQFKLGLWFLLYLLSYRLWAQSDTEIINKSLSFSGSGSSKTLIVDNIEGFIKVEGSKGKTVEIKVIKTIEGDDAEDIKKGKEELNVVFEERADTIIVHLSSPDIQYVRRGNHFSYKSCNYNDRGYRFKVDYTISVPTLTNVLVGTVNRGNVEVENVAGKVEAKNVNGSLTLKNIGYLSLAYTVNGDITADIINNPTTDTDFKTINGKIDVHYHSGLAADIEMKSFHGDFFTDYTEVSYLPAKVQKTEAKDDKHVYKISKSTRIRIGKGGPILKFETLNGDVYLSKN